MTTEQFTPITPMPSVARTTGLERAVDRLASTLARFSVDILRVALGLVFLAFGALKFFPDASPVQELTAATIDRLSFGMLSGQPALLLTAAIEVFIGLTLITGRWLKAGLLVLAGALVGIMSPLVLFAGELFPGGVPSLAGQYVLKDIVLVAAGLVVGAAALGARMVAPKPA